MIKVLLVDDQPLLRSGFAMILSTEDDIEVVAQSGNGKEAIAACATHTPDVVLMDVQMPVLDGVAATAQITAASEAKVIMLTTFDRDDYLFDALQAGASGFLLKNADPDDLIDGIRAVAAGHSLLAPEVTARVIAQMAGPKPEVAASLPSGAQDLTAREHEIWVLMARGLSNSEIAAETFVSEATVKTHVSKVLAKLEVRDRVQAVIAAYEAGVLTHPSG
ncbi:response regulator transcription factor [Ornithinimicrobium sp. Arc0846-15]|nr:response regulator transcription factor [Ornithinimicrobium laminariae]